MQGTPARDTKEASLADVAKSAAHDFFDLGAAQVKLARLEFGKDLRLIVGRSIGLIVAIPPLLLGYAFGMVALAHWLAAYWGQLRALLAVAAMNLILGGAGMIWAILALKRFQMLDRTAEEVSAGVAHVVKSVTQAQGTHHG